MKPEIKNVTSKFHGSYIETIFDPIQTHALYGVTKSFKNEAVSALKEAGAKRLRVVSNKFGFVIICFK
jgi:phospholipase/lecithinase/hemolysin